MTEKHLNRSDAVKRLEVSGIKTSRDGQVVYFGTRDELIAAGIAIPLMFPEDGKRKKVGCQSSLPDGLADDYWTVTSQPDGRFRVTRDGDWEPPSEEALRALQDQAERWAKLAEQGIRVTFERDDRTRYAGTRADLIAAGLADAGMFPLPPRRRRMSQRGVYWDDPKYFSVAAQPDGTFEVERPNENAATRREEQGGLSRELSADETTDATSDRKKVTRESLESTLTSWPSVIRVIAERLQEEAQGSAVLKLRIRGGARLAAALEQIASALECAEIERVPLLYVLPARRSHHE